MTKLREILSQMPVLTILTLVFLASLITYAVVGYSGGVTGAEPRLPKRIPGRIQRNH